MKKKHKKSRIKGFFFFLVIFAVLCVGIVRMWKSPAHHVVIIEGLSEPFRTKGKKENTALAKSFLATRDNEIARARKNNDVAILLPPQEIPLVQDVPMPLVTDTHSSKKNHFLTQDNTAAQQNDVLPKQSSEEDSQEEEEEEKDIQPSEPILSPKQSIHLPKKSASSDEKNSVTQARKQEPKQTTSASLFNKQKIINNSKNENKNDNKTQKRTKSVSQIGPMHTTLSQAQQFLNFVKKKKKSTTGVSYVIQRARMLNRHIYRVVCIKDT